MVTVRVCSKLKTSRKLVVFTDIVGKNSRYFVGVFNKTIIPLARVGDKLIIAKTNSALRASLAITISYPMRTRGIIANYAALLSNWEITYEWQNHSVKNHNCNPFCTFFVMIPFLIFSTASECLLLSKVNVDLGWRSLIRICSFRLPMCSLRRFIPVTFTWNLTTNCLVFTIFHIGHRRSFVFITNVRFSHFSDSLLGMFYELNSWRQRQRRTYLLAASF